MFMVLAVVGMQRSLRLHQALHYRVSTIRHFCSGDSQGKPTGVMNLEEKEAGEEGDFG
jgi:hypothetical protein